MYQRWLIINSAIYWLECPPHSVAVVEDNVIDLKSLVKACARNPGDVSREFQVSNSYCLTICLGFALHIMVGNLDQCLKQTNR
jgi:hypothetical protein